jgi:hypothetical protein
MSKMSSRKLKKVLTKTDMVDSIQKLLLKNERLEIYRNGCCLYRMDKELDLRMPTIKAVWRHVESERYRRITHE